MPFKPYSLSPGFLASLEQVILPLPSSLKRAHTKLEVSSHSLLLQKQKKLRTLDLAATHTWQGRYLNQNTADNQPQLHEPNEHDRIGSAVTSTLIFASDAAGTAIFIHESGLVLTCAHCVAESREQYDNEIIKDGKVFWLLSAGGNAVKAVCVAWDNKRDLALLRVIAFQQQSTKYGTMVESSANSQTGHITTASIKIASSMPIKRSPIVCIGHPGSEDLEAEIEGVKTHYPVLAISEGQYLGYAKQQNIQDNSDIGALMHSAWTHWGHSGAPIVDARSGQLIGLHSSWDEEHGTRRGVGVEAIQGFLEHIETESEQVVKPGLRA